MGREILAVCEQSYKDPLYVNLDNTHKDGEILCRLFKKEFPKGYRFDRAKLMKDPTAAEVTAYLEEVLKRLDDDSVFVFYFSGHGLYNSEIDRQLLLCKDALGVLADGHDGTGALSLDFMTSFSQRAKGKVIFIYDCCRTAVEKGHKANSDFGRVDKFKTATSERPNREAYGGSGRRWSIMSCGKGERSKDDGSFVKALSEVMRESLKSGRELCLETDAFVQRVYYRLGMGSQKPEASGDSIVLVPAGVATERRSVGFSAIWAVVAIVSILFGLSQRSTDSGVKELKELITEQSREIADQSREIADQSREIADQSREIADQSHEIIQKRTEISELERKNRELSKLLDEIKESSGAAPDSAEFLKLKDENASLSKELAELKMQSSSTTQDLSSKDAELAALAKRFDELQKSAEALKSEISSKDARIKELESLNAVSTKKLTSAEKDLADARREYGDLKKTADATSTKLTQTEKDLATAKSQNQTLNETITSLRARLSEQSKSDRTEEQSSTPSIVSGAPAAGSPLELTINGVKVVFRYCPAGTFMMGSPDSEEDRYNNEVQHEVRLTRGFWLLETPVTQALWKAVMGKNPSRFKGEDLPVESVSWNDCFDFVKKLNEGGYAPNGMKFDFPTEAEWEYACRAGSSTRYSFGNEINASKANYNEKVGKTTPVKKYPPNAWNLWDMHGNVCEWVYDWYGDYPSGSVTDPTGPTGGSYRVLRGGSWNLSAEYCQSAFRSTTSLPIGTSLHGFRLALRSAE